jgi:hypothetical protein
MDAFNREPEIGRLLHDIREDKREFPASVHEIDRR